jgi:tellurite resistance protein TehA-like permease
LPSFFISIVNIQSNIQIYGVPHCRPWLSIALRVLFWIYAACTFLVAVAEYYFLFTGKQLTIQSITSQSTLPVFPVMLSGTLASLVGQRQPPEYAPDPRSERDVPGIGHVDSDFYMWTLSCRAHDVRAAESECSARDVHYCRTTCPH